MSHTHILFVERLNFLTTSGVAMFRAVMKGSELRAKRAFLVQGFSLEKFLEGTPFRMLLMPFSSKSCPEPCQNLRIQGSSSMNSLIKFSKLHLPKLSGKQDSQKWALTKQADKTFQFKLSLPSLKYMRGSLLFFVSVSFELSSKL